MIPLMFDGNVNFIFLNKTIRLKLNLRYKKNKLVSWPIH